MTIDDDPEVLVDADPTRRWCDPIGVLDRSSAGWKRVEKRLARQPLARLTTAGPRTARWIIDEIRAQALEPAAGAPSTRMTPSLISHVAMDESILAIAMGPNRFPRRADFERVGAEMRQARAVFERRGWLDDPASYHRTPPPMTDVTLTKGWALGQSYQRLWWPSGFEPQRGVPGRERWLEFEKNRTASAWILRHSGEARPWVICVHGFGTGSVFMDLFSFHAAHLHHDLGVNVAAIVLPVHGSRKPNRLSGEEFLGFDLMNSVHGLTQAVWDVRRLLSWVREQGPSAVGIFGVSLGGFVTSLVSAFESDLDLALAGIPVVDFPELIRHHAPHHLNMRSIEHNILDGTAQDVHRVVTPLAMAVAVPPAARAIFAGMGDRLATTEQARRLWEHWEEPETCWFPGSHVGYLWSDKVWRFVDSAFESRGLAV